MRAKNLAQRYVFFAVLATIANLMTQRLVLFFGNDALLFACAIVAGTLTGLLLKYALDKRWIFEDASVGIRAHARLFSAYTFMGVVTTSIFWGVETAFWLLWKTDGMREVGAVIGLAIGYWIKFNLDLRFVFNNRKLAKNQ